MTRPEMDALIALHDRWSAHDVLLFILSLTAGLVLVAGSFVALFDGEEGLAAFLVIVGVTMVAAGLNKEPFVAR